MECSKNGKKTSIGKPTGSGVKEHTMRLEKQAGAMALGCILAPASAPYPRGSLNPVDSAS